MPEAKARQGAKLTMYNRDLHKYLCRLVRAHELVRGKVGNFEKSKRDEHIRQKLAVVMYDVMKQIQKDIDAGYPKG